MDHTASAAPPPAAQEPSVRELVRNAPEQVTVLAVPAQGQQKLGQLTARMKITAGQASQQGTGAVAAAISNGVPEPVRRAAGTIAGQDAAGTIAGQDGAARHADEGA